MSALQEALDEYLAARRALGHKLRLSGRLLQRFVAFADSCGATFISTEIAVAWAMQPTKAHPAQWANRLGMVRRFARYCSAIDPRTVVPPDDVLPHRYRRPAAPYIYRDDEVIRLVEAAKQLPSSIGLRPQTFATLFGLYAATGLRCNEPLRLDRGDVDLMNGVLTVRDTKFGKSRYVPVHPSTQHVLQVYATCRDQSCPNPVSPSFFLSERGTRLTNGQFDGPSSSCRARSACAQPTILAGHACTTFAIAWP
jgi:integrase/recombinase XerD